MESPCIQKCTLDPKSEYCISCKRTIDQIMNWKRYSTEQRKQIMDNLR